MTWGYTPRGGLPREEIEHADFANALDRAMSLSGEYVAGLSNGQTVQFSLARFLDGGAVHLEDVIFLPGGPPAQLHLPGGLDLLIDCIVWVAETKPPEGVPEDRVEAAERSEPLRGVR